MCSLVPLVKLSSVWSVKSSRNLVKQLSAGNGNKVCKPYINGANFYIISCVIFPYSIDDLEPLIRKMTNKRYRGKIVLCKGEMNNNSEVEDAYVKVMKSADFICDVLSTFHFEFINLQELRAYLSEPQSYAGLILTSPRAVEAISQVLKQEQVVDFLEHWKSLPVYCIGPATESLARNCLGLRNCLGAESGNAEKLAKQIVCNMYRSANALLYPCSEIARDTLPQILATDGIKIQKLVVYRTLASKTLEDDLLKVIKPPPQIFVFFSPSAVEYVITLLKEQTSVLDDVKVVAIGPVTGQALREVGIKVDAISDKPEPIALLRAIEEAD